MERFRLVTGTDISLSDVISESPQEHEIILLDLSTDSVIRVTPTQLRWVQVHIAAGILDYTKIIVFNGIEGLTGLCGDSVIRFDENGIPSSPIEGLTLESELCMEMLRARIDRNTPKGPKPLRPKKGQE